MLRRYAVKVANERQALLGGDVVGPDFALRQLTYMEMIIDPADVPGPVLALWSNRPSYDQPQHATEVCRLLDRVRRDVWQSEDGLIRPPPVTLPPRAAGPAAFSGGDRRQEREAAQAEACRRMAEAQALWEAAATEETWAEWCEASG